MKLSGLRLFAVGAVVAGGLLMVACKGEDRPRVDVIEDSGSSSASSSASGTGEAAAGVVEDKPADATEVDVRLKEWEITPSETTVNSGQVYFLAQNASPSEPHEFVVVKTDAAADALPVVDGRVPEDQIDIVDEIEPFAAGSSASLTLDLEPGHYVFICNIAGHYELGMRAAFTVE